MEMLKSEYWREFYKRLVRAKRYVGEYVPVEYFKHVNVIMIIDSRE